jgi:toxin ParE1/3/4
MKVVWTDRAKARLGEIHEQIERTRPAAAAKVVRRLVKRSAQLAAAPHSGRRVPEYDRDDIREVLERPYRIVYRVAGEEQRIDVLTVYHYRQLLPSDQTAR